MNLRRPSISHAEGAIEKDKAKPGPLPVLSLYGICDLGCLARVESKLISYSYSHSMNDPCLHGAVCSLEVEHHPHQDLSDFQIDARFGEDLLEAELRCEIEPFL